MGASGFRKAPVLSVFDCKSPAALLFLYAIVGERAPDSTISCGVGAFRSGIDLQSPLAGAKMSGSKHVEDAARV